MGKKELEMAQFLQTISLSLLLALFSAALVSVTYAQEETTTRLNTSDSSKATCDATCDNSDNGQLSDYSFGIPSGAAINGTGASSTVQYIHTDHLGGTGVVTDLNGNQTELTDYYPYGTSRIDDGIGVGHYLFSSREIFLRVVPSRK